jgi:hypothetical protein
MHALHLHSPMDAHAPVRIMGAARSDRTGAPGRQAVRLIVWDDGIGSIRIRGR